MALQKHKSTPCAAMAFSEGTPQDDVVAAYVGSGVFDPALEIQEDTEYPTELLRELMRTLSAEQ